MLISFFVILRYPFKKGFYLAELTGRLVVLIRYVGWVSLPQDGPTPINVRVDPLDASNSGPIFGARLGGGPCLAVDVCGLIEYDTNSVCSATRQSCGLVWRVGRPLHNAIDSLTSCFKESGGVHISFNSKRTVGPIYTLDKKITTLIRRVAFSKGTF